MLTIGAAPGIHSKDVNPICDPGCQRSVGGLQNLLRLSDAIQHDFELLPLDCPSFLHGFGLNCVEPTLAVGIWKFSDLDLNNRLYSIQFYVLDGEAPILMGNDYLSKADVLGTQSIIRFPKGILSAHEILLPTYTSIDLRTFLNIVPREEVQVKTLASSIASNESPNANIIGAPINEGNTDQSAFVTQSRNKQALKQRAITKKGARLMARRIHLGTHLPHTDVMRIVRNAGIETVELEKALKRIGERCEICLKSGRPLIMRKGPRTLHSNYNDSIQVDFCYVEGLRPSLPILAITERSTGFTRHALVRSRDIDEVASVIERVHFMEDGPPNNFRGDAEFDNKSIRDMLSRNSVTFQATPARRHNKIGQVERSHGVFKIIARKFIQQTVMYSRSSGYTCNNAHLVKCASYFSNLMAGTAALSPFERAKGYTPSVGGVPQAQVSRELREAFEEKRSLSFIDSLLKGRNPRTVKGDLLQPVNNRKRQVYYFVKLPNTPGRWITGYVKSTGPFTVIVTATENGSGHKRTVAYEDIRLAPSLPFMKELMENQLLETPYGACNENRADNDEGNLAEETVSLLTSTNGPIEIPSKDIGDADSLHNKEESQDVALRKLASVKQQELKKALDIFGPQYLRPFEVQSLPSWIVDDAIARERTVWGPNILKVSRREIPRDANIISSHAVCHIKNIGDGETLKLKMRVVPHGNRDREKGGIRSDSSTAPFVVIRSVLSFCTLLGFRMASIDVAGAYFQAEPLKRDVYMIPPKIWKDPRGTIYKLLRPAYGLVESGRLWQIAIEKWLDKSGFIRLSGFPQLFIQLDDAGKIKILLAKVVDDLLLGGSVGDLTKFHKSLSSSFRLGRFICNKPFEFHSLFLTQDEKGSITMSMNTYLQKVQAIPITKEQKRIPNELCPPEFHALVRQLAGSLNYIGQAILPPAAYTASWAQQQLGRLRMNHVILMNKQLTELRKLTPKIVYQAIINAESIVSSSIVAFSDAAHGASSYGQTGYLGGLFIELSNGRNVYHVVDWHSGKQKRVSFSSAGSEIIAASESTDRGGYLHELFTSTVVHPRDFGLSLLVDSRGLHDTITTLHEPSDYRLRSTVARMRDSFESTDIGELTGLGWIPGGLNLADCLTKCNPNMWAKLQTLLTEGSLSGETLRAVHFIDSKTWC